MPLHADTKTLARRLDALDNAVAAARIDHHRAGYLLDRLMVGRIDVHLLGADDIVQLGAGFDGDFVPRLVPGIGLFVLKGPRHFVRDMLDQRAAKHHRQQLLAAADAEHRHVALQRCPRDGDFKLGAVLFQGHGIVGAVVAVKGRIDIEIAAGHHQRIDAGQQFARQIGLVGQDQRHPAGLGHRRCVVVAERVPGEFGIAASRLGIGGDADQGFV